MEVDFPTSREDSRRDILSDDASRYTDISDTDGFLGWPSGRSSVGSTDGNISRRYDNRDEQSVSSHPKIHLHYSISSDNGDDDKTVGTVAVEFPSDRAPFRRRKSGDSIHSMGSLSGYKTGGSKGTKGTAGAGGESSDNDSSTAASRSLGAMGQQLKRGRRASLSSSIGSNASHNTSPSLRGNLRGSMVRRRSKSAGKVERTGSLLTIKSDQSFRNSGRLKRSSSGEFGQSLRDSLVIQSSGSSRELRKSLERKDRESHTVPTQTGTMPRRKSRELKDNRQSLRQLNDDNVSALPLLGWDQDSDSSSLHSSSRHSNNFRGSVSKSGRGSFGPASINPLPRGMRASGTSTNQLGSSVSSSMKASQIDSYGDVDGLCEEFVPRSRFQNMMNESQAGSKGVGGGLMSGSSHMDPNSSKNDQNNNDLLKMMMEEEHDPRKPWRKAPPAGSVTLQQSRNNQHGGRPTFGRRQSGFTMRSSFTSDMSYGDVMLQEMQQAPLLSKTATAAIEEALGVGSEEGSIDAKSAGLTAVAVVASIEVKDSSPLKQDETASVGGSDTIGDNTLRTSKRSVCSCSALSEASEGSDLTELVQAQEALFSVPESVSVCTSQKDDDDSSIHSEINNASDPLSSSIRSNASNRSRTRDLSSLDIVQEERAQYHHHPSDRQQQHLAPVNENGGSDDGEEKMGENEEDPLTGSLDELDDLPSSSFNKSMTKRGSNKLDDDSVSYSDIDVEPGQPQPSIKMCMTVRDSIIEREFATEQLTDVEFGETKVTHDAEMTLEDLLEGPSTRNDPIDVSYHNLQDSMRSGVNTSSSKKSSKRTISTMSVGKVNFKKGVMKQTSKFDTKATKNLRRKNKRLYKFCVWNCRKITLCLILGLCVLAGLAALAWWGAAKVTANKKANTASEAGSGDVDISSDGGDNNEASSSAAPAGSESKQWPPVVDSGRNPQTQPSESPSISGEPSLMPSSLRGSAPVVELPPELGANLTSQSNDTSIPTLSLVEQEMPSTSPTTASSSNANEPSLTNSSLPAVPSVELTYFNDTGTPSIYSYTESDGQTDPSLAPSEIPSSFSSSNGNESMPSIPSIHPSFEPSLEDLNISSQVFSTYPISSPSPWDSSFIDEQTVANVSNASAYPSVSPSNNASYTKFPYANSSKTAAYPSLSPSIHNSTFIQNQQSQPINLGDVTISPGTSLPSNTSQSPSSSSSTSNTAASYPTPSPLSNFSTYQPSFSNTNLSINKSNAVGPTPSDRDSKYKSIQAVSGVKEFEYAGASVSISPTGEFIAVGFKEANSPIAERAGLVRVYQRNNDNSYSPLGQDGMFGKEPRDEFGASISIANSGKHVAVGARSSSISEDKQKNGQVSVFEYQEASNTWIQLGSSIQGMDEKDRFGFSVSISGDGSRVAVGAPRGNGGTGSVSIYEYSGSNWILFDEIIGDEVNERAGFSASLSSDGDTLAVGVFASSKNGLTRSGSVSVYKLKGSVADNSSFLVNQGQTLVGAIAGAQFGYSVSVSGNGSRLVVGSIGYGTAKMDKTGLCEVYELQSNTWTKIGAMIGRAENEEAGSHVSIASNGNAVSCSRSIHVNGAVKGAVSILEETEAGWDAYSVISSVENSISFGSSVSLSQNGNTILSGAPSYNSSTGYFEMFTRSQ